MGLNTILNQWEKLREKATRDFAETESETREQQ
jgi:hypothetical protein